MRSWRSSSSALPSAFALAHSNKTVPIPLLSCEDQLPLHMNVNRLCCVLLCAGLTIQGGQQQSAAVEGFVTSDLASALPGTTIRIDTVTRGYHRETITNTSGFYSIQELPPGAYSIFAGYEAYGCIIYPQVALMPGQHLRQDFHFARAKRFPEGCEPAGKKAKCK